MMAARRFLCEFRLEMPRRGNATSSSFGKDRDYLVYRSLDYGDMFRLFGPPREDGRRWQSWNHHWDDGWAARIDGRVLEPGERRKKSDGFAGYEWMVDSIIRDGEIRYAPKPRQEIVS